MATLNVPADYPTIADAIAAANPGDTIAVAAGYGFENVSVTTDDLLITESTVARFYTLDASITRLRFEGSTEVQVQGGVSGDLAIEHLGPGKLVIIATDGASSDADGGVAIFRGADDVLLGGEIEVADPTTAGALDLIVISDADGVGGGKIDYWANTRTNGGDVLLSGGVDPEIAGRAKTNAGGGDSGVGVGGFILSGAGSITLRGAGADVAVSSHGIDIFSSDGRLESTDGAILVDGLAFGENGSGVLIRLGGVVRSTNGGIDIAGQNAGAGTGGLQTGVVVSSAALVESLGAGAISINGLGGTSSGSGNYGVLVAGAATQIRSDGLDAAGAITIQGTGRGTGGQEHSVVITDNATVVSRTGDILIGGYSDATGAASFSCGLLMTDDAVVESIGAAAIRLYGTGAETSGVQNFGVLINTGATVRSNAIDSTGFILISGASRGDGAGSVALQLDRDSLVSSLVGDISVSGINYTTGGAGQSGVVLDVGSDVETVGAADIFISGFGGAGSGSDSYGTWLKGAGTEVRSRSLDSTGTISIDGTARGTGAAAVGVLMGDNALVSSREGNIAVTGASNATGTAGDGKGVYLWTGADVTSLGGADISIRGTGSTSSGAYNIGVQLDGAGTVVSSGSTGGDAGTITIAGTARGTGNFAYGVLHFNSALVSSRTGDVAITGESNATGTAQDQTGVFITSGGDVETLGAAKIAITGTGGQSSGLSNHGVSLSDAGTEIRSNGADSTGAITIDGVSRGTGGQAYGVSMQGGALVSSKTGDISITGRSDTTGTMGTQRGVFISLATVETLGVADIAISATGSLTSGASNHGLRLTSSAQVRSIAADSTGTITLTGTARSGSDADGVQLDNNTLVTSRTGDIQIQGASNASGSAGSNEGVVVFGGADVVSAGAADITIVGTGGAGDGQANLGVRIDGATTTIRANDAGATGAITITGASGGTGQYSAGVVVVAATVSSRDGDVTITGTSNATGAADTQHGVLTNGAVIETVGAGDIVISGVGGAVSAANSAGIDIWNGTQVRATGAGSVYLTGEARAAGEPGVWVEVNSLVSTTTGDILLRGLGGSGVRLESSTVQTGSGAGADVTLSLTGGGVGEQIGTGGIVADGLRLLSDATASFTLNAASNDVNLIAGAVTGSISFTDIDDLAIGGVNSAEVAKGPLTNTTGLLATGAVALTAGSLTVNQNVTALGVTLTTTATGAAQVLEILAGATVDGGAGGITLNAGDDLTVAALATLSTTGALVINLDTGAVDAEGGVLTFAGAIDAASTTVNGGADDDTVTFDSAVLTAVTVNAGDGADRVTGGSGADILNGDDGTDTLRGALGGDVLDGGTGADVMDGGDGADTYYVDDAGDRVVEAELGGSDTIFGSVTVNTLANGGDWIENITLTGTADIDAIGNLLANRLTGNSGANRLTGNGGDDVLDGGAGADVMDGGRGSDTYYIDNAGDRVVEDRLGAFDTIYGSVTVNTLTNGGAWIEDVILTGTGDIDAVGNRLDNRLTGNSGSNILNGYGGADIMEGGDGLDVYIVDNVGDQVIETGGTAGGLDHVSSFISYTLGDSVENLQLLGVVDIDGSGNDARNTIVGNGGDNRITGGGDVDILQGRGGVDTFVYTDVADSTLAGYDRILDLGADDFIDLAAVDANSRIAGDQDFTQVERFTRTAGELTMIHDAARNFTTLLGDVDGDGRADFRIVLLGGDFTGFDGFIGVN